MEGPCTLHYHRFKFRRHSTTKLRRNSTSKKRCAVIIIIIDNYLNGIPPQYIQFHYSIFLNIAVAFSFNVAPSYSEGLM